jgi:hypothetical protein
VGERELERGGERERERVREREKKKSERRWCVVDKVACLNMFAAIKFTRQTFGYTFS